MERRRKEATEKNMGLHQSWFHFIVLLVERKVCYRKRFIEDCFERFSNENTHINSVKILGLSKGLENAPGKND